MARALLLSHGMNHRINVWLFLNSLILLGTGCMANTEEASDQVVDAAEQAVDNNGTGGPPRKMSDLETDGYSCERISSAGYSCTKTCKPEKCPDYLCDNNGDCNSTVTSTKPTVPAPVRPPVLSPSPTPPRTGPVTPPTRSY